MDDPVTVALEGGPHGAWRLVQQAAPAAAGIERPGGDRPRHRMRRPAVTLDIVGFFEPFATLVPLGPRIAVLAQQP